MSLEQQIQELIQNEVEKQVQLSKETVEEITKTLLDEMRIIIKKEVRKTVLAFGQMLIQMSSDDEIKKNQIDENYIHAPYVPIITDIIEETIEKIKQENLDENLEVKKI